MIPEAPFLFSIAGLSASLAGLAGLVAGLRRGADLRPLDAFRLRQIVEFAFANIILALAVVPLTLLQSGPDQAVRLSAVATILYLVWNVVALGIRSTRAGIAWTPGWRLGAAILSSAALIGSILALTTASLAVYEVTLIALLARPMFAFLLVLASIGGD